MRLATLQGLPAGYQWLWIRPEAYGEHSSVTFIVRAPLDLRRP